MQIQAIRANWNDRFDAARLHKPHESTEIVPLISNDGVGREFPDPVFRVSDIGCLPCGENEISRPDQGNSHRAVLGAKRPAHTSNVSISVELFSAPAA